MKPIPYMLVAAGALIPSLCSAGHCHQLYHVRAVPVIQQQILYSVGDSLRIEAAVEKALAKRAGTLEQKAPVASVLAAKCVRCHGEGKQAGGVDFRYSLSDYHFRRTVEMLGEGIDVPEAMKGVIAGLTPAEKGGITSEAIRLPAKREEPAVAPSPMDEEGVLR